MLKRAFLLLFLFTGSVYSESVVYLEQGWSLKDRAWFYSVDQGSRLVPYDIFFSLEQTTSESLFAERSNLETFGFLFQQPNDSVPIGFARNERELGLTCAACHTANVEYKGTTLRIDGGAGQTDLSSFLEALGSALQANLEGPKFNRLAKRMNANDSSSKDALLARLKKSAEERQRYNTVNRSDLAYGFGRLDAFGRIYNRVLQFAKSNDTVPANAPVSYPFLWDAPQHDYVQWVGSTSNAGAGSLARNVGQVVGVFGHVEIQTRLPQAGYNSSAQIGELLAIETQLKRLTSPIWPEDVLPPINRIKAASGRILYETHCLSCHQDIERSDPSRKVFAQMYGIDLVGTDGKTATNIVQASGDTGILKGKPVHFPVSIDRFGATSRVNYMLRHLVEGILIQNPGRIVQSAVTNVGAIQGERQGKFKIDPNDPLAELLAYKSRPLNGIWATAPYLHNGSVPTVEDLLLPAAKRPVKFKTGSKTFDPGRVGFISSEGPFTFDTTLPGNRNTGHEYGTNLSDQERRALLEYIKSL
ncbi:MAG: cytochrome c [Spirochaetia bacterium]|nr:cytochrome c [Spirochaetia bacterium]